MSADDNRNMPAFPQIVRREELSNHDHYVSVLVPEGGMALRDYFAAQMLTGIAKEPGEGCKGYIAQRVRVAYTIADEMLKQRAK